MSDYLERHTFPDDIKSMSIDDLELLSYEIRDFLVEKVSKTGGHLSSNLGVVELAIAIHRIFDAPKDKIIWDVGHQSYVHKILTGRLSEFDNLRRFGGMSGFPKSDESEYDVFDTGHSSTSVSLGLGLAAARDISGGDYDVVSVIGDGAMTGGLAFEALNNVDSLKSKLIVVLNDNGMSISPNTGGLSRHLVKLRSSRKYINIKSQIKKNVSRVPVIGESVVAGMQHARDSIKYAVIDGVMFEELGFRYLGPIDGHNIGEICETLELAKEASAPVLIHAMTKKGKGYTKAEANPNVFHGIGPFDPETGQLLKKSTRPTYSRIFGNKLIDMAQSDERIVAVSAAMTEGTGLEKFGREFPKRTFDVGIAEEHAVTFSAGLAKAGLKPFVAIYSTFLQRAYDQILEDVCLQNLPVVFCIDRAGCVGEDGETHHGLFDLTYLPHMPNMTVMAPQDGVELEQMMEYALQLNSPCAIRYPRGTAPKINRKSALKLGKSHCIKKGEDLEIWAIGSMVEKAVETAEVLKKDGMSASVVNMKFASPIDRDRLIKSCEKYPLIVTLEDNVKSGGVGEKISSLLATEFADTINKTKIVNIGWPDTFVEHGACDKLYRKYGMDPESVAERIQKELEEKA